ncbi:hypothetical protein ACQ858_22670 [Variovorax ureilyticus]|uniref:hypothetical protein n=1 Tax=Variovorax ureilyticus TaxID=1836198 RepID=UPI003D67D32F
MRTQGSGIRSSLASSGVLHRVRWLGALLACAAAWVGLAAVAATPAETATMNAQVRALKRAGDAVVALDVTATEGRPPPRASASGARARAW